MRMRIIRNTQRTMLADADRPARRLPEQPKNQDPDMLSPGKLRPVSVAMRCLHDTRTEGSRRAAASVVRSPVRAGWAPLGALIAGLALAQEPVYAQPAPDLTLADAVTLPPINVTGTSNKDYAPTMTSIGKIAVPLRDIPQSMTVIDRAVLDAQGVASLQDALRYVPGITIGSAEGGTIGNNVNLRGFSARTDIYLDGMRDRGQYYRDTFFLDAVEVLKGPSSMLFGRGSTGGVINQVSKTPSLIPLDEVTATVGSNAPARAPRATVLPVGIVRRPASSVRCPRTVEPIARSRGCRVAAAAGARSRAPAVVAPREPRRAADIAGEFSQAPRKADAPACADRGADARDDRQLLRDDRARRPQRRTRADRAGRARPRGQHAGDLHHRPRRMAG